MDFSTQSIIPESFLADTQDHSFNEKNNSNYKFFVNNWTAHRTVSFLGAGTSNPLGIKDWKDLTESLRVHVKDNYGVEVDCSIDDLPLVAEKLFQVFEANNKKEDFDKIVFQNMEPRISSTSPTLIYLAKILDIHFTTNFDDSLNGAYEFIAKNTNVAKTKTSYAIPNLPGYHQIFGNKGAHIVYLHGKKGGPYIFKLRDYQYFYPTDGQNVSYSKSIEDCLKAFLKEKSFLFIGFSFKDKRLKEMVFRVISEIKTDMLINKNFLKQNTPGTQVLPPHFLLVHYDSDMFGGVDWDNFFSEFERYGIYPIIYKKGMHIFLEHLLVYLTDREAV